MRANAGDLGISPDHIAVTGNSAGGHLSLMVAGVDGTLYPELEGDSGSAGVSSAVQACGAVYPVTIASPHKSVLNPIGRDGSRHIDRTVMPEGSTPRDLVMFSPCASHALLKCTVLSLLRLSGQLTVTLTAAAAVAWQVDLCLCRLSTHLLPPR